MLRNLRYIMTDICLIDNNVEKKCFLLNKAIKEIIHSNKVPLVIGGGHELSYFHHESIRRSGEFPAVINIDSHFDLKRTNIERRCTSGTPFEQIYRRLEQNESPLYYYCLGIQKNLNFFKLLNSAKRLKVLFVTYKDNSRVDNNVSLTEKILNKHKKLYVSVCLDALGLLASPGVSAPQIYGMNLFCVLKVLRLLKYSNKVIALDLAELNPLLDVENVSAKLAAYTVLNYVIT